MNEILINNSVILSFLISLIVFCKFTGEGFDSAMVFSDGGELFEELWRIWYEHEVLTPVLGTPLAELDYDEIFQTLSKDRQEEISEKKKYFLDQCKDAFG